MYFCSLRLLFLLRVNVERIPPGRVIPSAAPCFALRIQPRGAHLRVRTHTHSYILTKFSPPPLHLQTLWTQTWGGFSWPPVAVQRASAWETQHPPRSVPCRTDIILEPSARATARSAWSKGSANHLSAGFKGGPWAPSSPRGWWLPQAELRHTQCSCRSTPATLLKRCLQSMLVETASHGSI